MNENLSAELAEVKGQLQAMALSMGRIEQSLEKVVAMDRALAVQAEQMATMASRIEGIEHEFKGWRQQQLNDLALVNRRHEELAKDYNTSISSMRGAITAMKAFSGLATILVVATTGWAYSQINTNTQVNQRQEFMIETMKRDMAQLIEKARDRK